MTAERKDYEQEDVVIYTYRGGRREVARVRARVSTNVTLSAAEREEVMRRRKEFLERSK
jgi:hypothetical protein